MNNSKKQFIQTKTRLNGSGFIEYAFYELKPLLYIYAISFLAKTNYEGWLWYKYACMGFMMYTVYIIYSRLSNRGYL